MEGVKSSGARPEISLADVCAGLCVSGGSGGRLGLRVTLGSSGTHMSLAHGSCGSWRTTGGSRCCTCYTRSWRGRQKASCRNTSPGPTSRHLGRQGRSVHRVELWSICQTCNNVIYCMHQCETLPESTMMSSSSPDPSSSLKTTCFPWRNTVLFPEKPSTFCTFTIPSSMS